MIIFRAILLAIADLLHGWILSLCVVLALAAALAPVLILLSLKNGVVQTMRDDLARDPANLEISPVLLLSGDKMRDKQWFRETAARPDVAYVIPNMRIIGPQAEMSKGDSAPDAKAPLIPSSPGDPLLVENGAVAPRGMEVALSTPLASSLGAGVGDKVKLSFRRRTGGTSESHSVELMVCGVADPRASGQMMAWTPLEIVEDVENYQRGGPVARFGWPGDSPAIQAVYPAVVSVSRAEIPILPTIINGTGFTKRRDLPAEEFQGRTGIKLPADLKLVLWEAHGDGMNTGGFEMLAGRLIEHGIPPLLLPWPEEPAARLDTGDGREWSLKTGDASVLDPLAAGKIEEAIAATKAAASADSAGLRTLRVPGGDPALQLVADLMIPHGGKETKLRIMIQGAGEGTGQQVLLDPALVAQLREVVEGTANVSSESGQITPVMQRFKDFRAYARDLEDVVPLTSHLQQQLGMDIRSSIREVTRIQTLDRHLTSLFNLIAAVTGGAAFLGFASNIYAGVRRRRKAMAHLRLLGFGLIHLMVFPCVQALLLASAAMGTSLVAYRLFQMALESRYASELRTSEICRLLPEEVSQTGVIVAGVALLSALIAGIGVLRVDPARHLREE